MCLNAFFIGKKRSDEFFCPFENNKIGRNFVLEVNKKKVFSTEMRSRHRLSLLQEMKPDSFSRLFNKYDQNNEPQFNVSVHGKDVV